jgi:imidazoleglycerol phosphate synthase glutamine amidotransferase subunit HisH
MPNPPLTVYYSPTYAVDGKIETVSKSKLVAALIEAGEAYFLHSYHFDATDDAEVLAKTDHGGPLVAAVGRDNIMGVQFHPEKSQAYGINFLKRFLEWMP